MDATCEGMGDRERKRREKKRDENGVVRGESEEGWAAGVEVCCLHADLHANPERGEEKRGERGEERGEGGERGKGKGD